MGKWIVVLAFAAGAVMGESLPPQESNGVKIGEPVVLDLAPWADDISARRGFTEVRAGGTLQAAGKGVTHWVENRGATRAVLIVADVYRK